MRRTEVLQGPRRMKFENVYGRWQARRLSQAEAPGARRGDRRARPAVHAGHRPGQPLLPYPQAGEKVAKDQPTQVGRALASSASSTSRPTRPKHEAAPSGRSARCRTVCPKSSSSPRSPPSMPPTGSSGKSTCPSTTLPSRSRPSNPTPPSSPTPRACGCASTTIRTARSRSSTRGWRPGRWSPPGRHAPPRPLPGRPPPARP
jgi:hypothetical protein